MTLMRLITIKYFNRLTALVFTYLLHLHLYSISQHFDTSRSVSKTNRPVHSIPLFSLQVYLLCGEKGPANLKVLSSV
jgi:hypothetical protein